ncbi:hypothetical protein PGB90_005588 [Kerria lacca]
MTNLFETVRTEDYVEYFLFPIDYNPPSDEKLQEIYNKIFSFITPFTNNYIWQKDEFNLRKVNHTDSERVSSYLHGIVHYGENIEDEWFIVYLLLTFSKQCNDIFIRIIDSDGEFLLIEAAEHLPKWVYIHSGMIRILPLNITLSSNYTNDIIKHLNCLKNISDIEQVVTKIIKKKTESYSDNLSNLLHKSRAYLPVKVAAILDANPSLIAAAITAYCQMDPIDAKICKKMSHFPPQDIVLRLVTFTKFLYAMVSHQKLNFERNRSLWKLPLPSSSNFKESYLGYKITCGFEILASKYNTEDSDLTLNKKWIQYIEVLKRKGYFNDYLEGSKDYVNLEKKARQYFLDNMKIAEPVNNSVLNIIKTIKYDFDEMKKMESELQPSDDEKWMEINENEFNILLEKQFNLRGVNVLNSPEMLTAAINKFLNSASEIEGVELQDEVFNHTSNMDIDEDEESSEVLFNPEEFLPSIEKMLDLMELHNKNELSEDESECDFIDNSEDDNDHGIIIVHIIYIFSLDNEFKELTIKSYMDLMDKELQRSALSNDFIPESNDKSEKSIDVNLNTLTNLLKSYEEQFGGSGPTGNLLHSMGLRLETKKDN